jgi:hypothetical protein
MRMAELAGYEAASPERSGRSQSRACRHFTPSISVNVAISALRSTRPSRAGNHHVVRWRRRVADAAGARPRMRAQNSHAVAWRVFAPPQPPQRCHRVPFSDSRSSMPASRSGVPGFGVSRARPDLEAVRAVHAPVRIRFERHPRLAPAARAARREHLPDARAARACARSRSRPRGPTALHLAGRATCLAASWTIEPETGTSAAHCA